MATDSEYHDKYSIAVEPRLFIEDIAIPLLARARSYDPARKPQGLRKLKRKLGQSVDQFVHGWLRVPTRGILTIRNVDNSLVAFEFDAHQSAYLAFASRALHGGYEPVETMFLEAMLTRSMVFYDVGANWGYYSLLAATHPEFKGKVYAFDISHQMNADLTRLVESLETERVEVLGYGLSNHSGSVLTSGGRATHLTTIIDQSDRAAESGAPVLVNRLDNLALPPPDLMKIDVEDHEREVFEGSRRTLQDHHPLILFECRKDSDGGEAGAQT